MATACNPWPRRLWIVRHGESAGNVAHDLAYRTNASVIDIAERDHDVPLSRAGETQATALGRWFARRPEGERPNAMLASPYRRARDTGALLQREGASAPGAMLQLDERLREKEFGLLDRLTKLGIEQRFPEQAGIRERVGKFYYRPPGGESWCDVILRLRAVVGTLAQANVPDARVLIIAHQVTVLCLRYIIEGLTEEQILAIDARGDVANCGLTAYERDDSESSAPNGAMRLTAYNFVAPLESEGAPVTSQPDVPAGPTS